MKLKSVIMSMAAGWSAWPYRWGGGLINVDWRTGSGKYSELAEELFVSCFFVISLIKGLCMRARKTKITEYLNTSRYILS